MQAYRLTTEVFCLPHVGQYIAYAPLKKLVMLVNASAVNLLWELEQGKFSGANEKNLDVLSALIDMGLVNGPPDEVHEDADGEFRPTETTLFLTTACNLRCVYCYASGGETQQTLSWEPARAAVDFVAANAKSLNRDFFSLSFHGGGEPTVAWNLMTRITAYAEERSGREKLECRRALATNGVLTGEQLDWIAGHIDNVNVSVDGVDAAHDRQRPLRNGGPSFPHVLRTMQALSRRKRHYGLRMTVTRDNLQHVPEAVRFFCRNGTPATVHIEPVFRCGRCVSEKVVGPGSGEFVEVFRAARKIAEEFGAVAYYSGARYPEISAIFCQAAGQSFTVTTSGRVTACYEVSGEADPRSNMFFYGYYDGPSARFVFDEKKLSRLRELTVHRIPFCKQCFCKYHCAGDCPAKRLVAFEQGIPDTVSDRCYISQELTKDQIIQALTQGSRTVQVVAREYSLSKEGHSRVRSEQRPAGS